MSEGIVRNFGPRYDLKGKRFGRLLVLECVGKRKKMYWWRCQCDCGKEATVRTSSLMNGHTQSCGCFNRQRQSEANTTHGYSRKSDGTYQVWLGIKQRCNNPNFEDYHNYGGRGIRVCERWLNSFEAFLEDMGKRPSLKHSIDRYPNNDGNYEPGNCRWATWKEQQANRRDCVQITYQGETMHASGWAERFGMKAYVLLSRLKLGWSFEDAISKPIAPAKRMIEFKGKMQSATEWAKETGIRAATIIARLNMGWIPERALTEKVAYRGQPCHQQELPFR